MSQSSMSFSPKTILLLLIGWMLSLFSSSIWGNGGNSLVLAWSSASPNRRLIVTTTTSPLSSSSSSPSSVLSQTALSMTSSWGIKGASRWGGSESPAALAEAAALERKRLNPEQHVQAYLDPPNAVEARLHVDGTVLVSGMFRTSNSPTTTSTITTNDQFVFDLLHHEDSAFEFKKIVAFCPDVKLAKKRLLSRSARYTGLLDKLDFIEQQDPVAPLPTLEQLSGVQAWLSIFEKDDNDVGGKILLTEQLPMLAQLAQQTPTMRHVAILLTNAMELDPQYCQTAVQALEAAASAASSSSTDHNSHHRTLQYTIVTVGKWIEGQAEGKVPYGYHEMTWDNATLPANAVFGREESLRLITECLQLECGVNRSLVFREVYNTNETEAKLIKGLREAGYARPQEIDHMIRHGPQAFLQAIEDWKTSNPDAARGYTTTDAWWEDPKYARKTKSFEEEQKEEEGRIKDARTQEIEKIAREWAKREFFRERMGGSLAGPDDMTEAEYITRVWDRALKEGELKYRTLRGELTDADAAVEMENFQAKQERKKQTMLKKAKEELAELLDQEDLGGGDDLKAKLVLDQTEKDDDDDDEND